MGHALPADAPQSAPETPRTALTFRNCLLFAFGFAPLLLVFFLNLWSRPHYQFFPLALAGAAFLAWIRFQDRARPLRPGGRTATTILLSFAFFLLLAATVLWSPWLGVLGAFSALIGVIWSAGGKKLLRAMVPALLLLLAIIPPPLALDTRFAESLRVMAVDSSSRLLDLLNIIHSRSGNVIELPGQKLLVEEACSGINSVLVTMACCLFYMLWRRRSPVRILLGLVGSVSFVLLGNLARITLGAWLKARYGIEILSGWRHECVGILLFLTYLGLILSLDSWFAFLFTPVRARRPAPVAPVSTPAQPEPVVAVFSRGSARLAACAFAALGLLGLGLGGYHFQQDRAQPAIPKSALLKGATFSLPERIGDWTRLNSDSPLLQKVETMGIYSQVWHYQKGGTLASLALDYPFAGYHDVTLCYTLRGWRLLERQASDPKDSALSFGHAEMQNELGLFGALWFSTVDERGRWLDKPVMERNLLDKFKLPGKTETTTYRIQVLATAYDTLPAVDQQQLKDFFEQARGLLWRQLSAQMRQQ